GAVQGENDLRLVELVTRDDRRSEGECGALLRVGTRYRVENMPPCLGQDRAQVFAKQIERRRSQLFAEDSQSLPFSLADGSVVLGGKGVILLPGGRLPLLQ